MPSNSITKIANLSKKLGPSIQIGGSFSFKENRYTRDEGCFKTAKCYMYDNKKKFIPKWICVQAYKHDESLHRQWSPGLIVEETNDYWAVASRSSLITEADGRRWLTKENAVFILFKKEWLNVICMFKEEGGICYYANMASPTILDGGYLRYIDYDLDLKLYPDKVIKALDEQEFLSNAKMYGYTPDLISAVKKTFHNTRALMEQRKFPFDDQKVIELYHKYEQETIPFVPRGNSTY